VTAIIPAVPGRIFISYRREETAYAAGWLFDRLVEHFGRGQVFKDVDSIQLGDDFVEVITAAVGSCNPGHTIPGDAGRRRLDNPEDFVRLEIQAALTRDIRVIPILVDGARMPRAGELAPSLAKLVRRQALELSPSRFAFDTGRLLEVLDNTLAEGQARPVPTKPDAAGLALVTEDDATPRRNPSMELIKQVVAQLTLPNEGNGFLIIEREGELYAQAARHGADDYQVEYRDGDATKHFAAYQVTLAEAQAALCGWAFDLPGWRDRLHWTRESL
jgi:hypothetical protein